MNNTYIYVHMFVSCICQTDGRYQTKSIRYANSLLSSKLAWHQKKFYCGFNAKREPEFALMPDLRNKVSRLKKYPTYLWTHNPFIDVYNIRTYVCVCEFW